MRETSSSGSSSIRIEYGILCHEKLGEDGAGAGQVRVGDITGLSKLNMRNLRADMMIWFFLSWYHTLRASRKASEIGLESCFYLSSRKWIMTSAVAISNELEQVCSLAHLKASREA